MKLMFTLFVILFAVSLTFSQIAVYDTVSIDSIQYVPDPGNDDASRYVDDTLVVNVIACTGPRVFSSGARWSFLSSNGAGGPWSGIQIIQHDTASAAAQNTGLQFTLPGDEYYITGVVEEYSNGTQFAVLIDPDHYPTWISDNNPVPAPTVVPTGDLTDRTNGEQWEGVRVRVENAEVINNSLPFRECSLDDGSGLVELSAWFLSFRDSIDQGFYNYPPNGTNINAWGYVRDIYGNSTINPENSSNIQELTNPPIISDISRNPLVPTSSQDVNVSATIVDLNGTVTDVTLYYSVDYAAYTPLTMTTVDSVYSAQVPARPDQSFIRYFLKATDNDNHTSQAPGDTSQSTYFYFVRDAGMTIADIQYTPYPDGNSGMIGLTVTVTGIVMTDSTETSSYYYIQDSNAPWHGIRVRDSNNRPAKGDEVTITGEVEESNLVTRISNVSGFQINSSGNPMWTPYPTTVDQINAGTPLEEAVESVFLKLSGLTVTDPFPDDPGNYGEFTINDGTGDIRVDDYFQMFSGNLDSSFTLGTTIDSLYGFGYFAYSNPKVIPRGDYDLFGIVVNSIEKLDKYIPSGFILNQNYPNPFNPVTKITFSIGHAERVIISVYNLLGQKVVDLANLNLQSGNYEVTWNGLNRNGTQVSSGIYFYRIEAGSFVQTKKMTLIK